MATINIRSDVKDSFYRYKMPKLIAKVEGKGNGIKTVIPNMALIGKSLSRPAMYPTKFFGCELGAQTKYDQKNDRYIVNGAHDAGKLQTLLDGFINKFVLCGSCKNPETDLILGRDDSIIRDCKACGQRTAVDMRHKLVTFIIKNPPTPVTKGKSRKGKESSTTNGNGNGNGDDEEAENGASKSDEDDITRLIREGAAALPEAKSDDENDDDWAEDTSAEAQAQRLQEVEATLSKTQIFGGDEEEEDDEGDLGPTAYDVFGEAVEKNPTWSDAEIIAKAQELGVFGKHRAVVVLVQVIFDDKYVQQLRKRKSLLKKFVKTEKDQKSLLGGIERLVGLRYPEALPKLPSALKVLYDEDIVEEEVLVKWGSKASKRYVPKDVSSKVKKAAAPFITWLQEAEEESDEE